MSSLYILLYALALVAIVVLVYLTVEEIREMWKRSQPRHHHHHHHRSLSQPVVPQPLPPMLSQFSGMIGGTGPALVRDSPRIIFCTTCKGRVAHLEKTLPQNLSDNVSYPNCKFLILSYGDQEVQDYLASSQLLDDGQVVLYTYRTDSRFSMSHAKNMAARCAIREGVDILVTLDADNYTGPNFAQFVADKFAEPIVHPGMFLCPDFPLIQSLPHGPDRPKRGYAGRLAIRTQDFIKVGGYDETFDTWRGEDIDMVFRLQRIGLTMRHIHNCYLNAIPHSAEIRFKEYPEAQQFETKREYHNIASRTETIVNFGKIGCGLVYRFTDRDLDPRPVKARSSYTTMAEFSRSLTDLFPVPTRIFGIGLHKTATTSLHEAFQILGFDSLHWGAGEAPRIWYEMQSTGRSVTLEQYYALSDLPIPLLYRKLDQSYPGSRFILTIRNEQDWLKSVSRLWDPAYNLTRWIWDVYPFTNRIHTILYGQKEFDPKIFLARYRRHNEEVVEYFSGRDDLLVLDMDRSPNWQALCEFLDKPIPDVPYPQAFVTRSLKNRRTVR